MRVINQITFEAKDDAEALRIAAERLGKDAVILSTRTERVGGFMGLFQHPVLKVTAGILEEDDGKSKAKDKEADEQTRRENLVAFQKLIEFKDRQNASSSGSKNSSSAQLPAPVGGEGYRPLGTNDLDVPGTNPASASASTVKDNMHFSAEGVRSAYGLNSASGPTPVTSETSASVSLQQAILTPGAISQTTQSARSKTSDSTVKQPAQILEQAQAASEMLSVGEAKALRREISELSQRVDTLVAALSSQHLPSQSQQAHDHTVLQLGQAGQQGHASLPGNTVAPVQVQEVLTKDNDEADIARRLRLAEVDEKYIRKVLADYDISGMSSASGEKLPFEEWLASRIPCSGDDGNATGGRKVMFIGPTGVGKTTTIAKLAAIQALWEHKNVLLLTSDTYRIAAVDQLRTYARILGVPIEVVFDAAAIPEILNGHKDTDLVLLDTAGRAQRDKRSISVFEALYNAMQPDAVHLVLAANMKYRDMLDVVEHIPNIPVSHLIFTKLDETVSYGAIFNIQQVMGCPVSFLTGGQDVPKDIEMASGSRIVEFLMTSPDDRDKLDVIRPERDQNQDGQS